MELTDKELLLALSFALIGYLFSSRAFLRFLARLNPVAGLIVYYIILGAVITVLAKLGLVVLGHRIKTPLQTLGLVLITFSFFMLVNWESGYVQIATGYPENAVSPIMVQSEDGAVWYIWSQLLPHASVEQRRILTFVATPFILTLIGGLLVSEKIRLGV